ncbi:hypothetical protein BJX61DRAFT_538781 [Aspergillus egyptiacus]|nr:hypothetical protein BJX61DRAFT_538781 [Aspergillus egyptiacus]
MSSGLTLAIIGCGNMGSAILSGILDATTSENSQSPFSHIIASTRSKQSAEKLQARYEKHSSPINLQFIHGDNTLAAERADVLMLGCKPYLVADVLSEPGLSDKLSGKLVVSIIAGKTPAVLADLIKGNQTKAKTTTDESVVARAIPNVAAEVRESMTVVELPPNIQQRHIDIVDWMFSQIGQVKMLGADLFDLGSMLMASVATVSVAVDGILDGCVAEGMRRAEASEMTAQCLLGLAKLLKEGHHPAVLREAISSPRGCTIQGLLAVEKAGVRSAFAESVISGTRHLRELQK